MADALSRQLYALQYGDPSAYKKLMAEEQANEQRRQFNEQMNMQKEANAYEASSDPDWLQAVLGGLMTGAAFIPGPQQAIVGAPLIGAGAGYLGKGLTRKKIRNKITGQEQYA